MLPAPADDHAGERAAFFEKRAVGELLFSAAGNEILDHDLAWADVRGSTLEELTELCAIVRPPGLGLCRVDEVFLDGRLDGEWPVDRNLVQLLTTAGVPRLRRGDPELAREAVRVPLV